ncbi:damage-inducible protein CinA [Acinetobacter sp. ANC 4169]|uniref:CinA family protein n=1 Tax=Acinetobacter sp. ANC 4169 TaxID=1977879 RepID=UPI000A340383|nr:CinA family protein [Acinetobacter sp. ANC 4169]OTG77040.1 damage-inducible protein CinA [Acinetobacter sp. ANC 4169]
MVKKCCDLLEIHHLKIAFIESASSGYLSSQFSICKNSGAEILLGGLVSYDPSIKINILNIDAKLIEKYTAESAEVTEAMALQGKKLFMQADFVVACTGLLKPGGSATESKPEGTFFISILYLNKIHNFHYFIDGTPLKRLAVLTQHIADEITKLIQGI